MKRFKKLLAVLLIAALATGCVKYNATLDIKKDKSMDFTIIYAFDKSIMGEASTLKEEDFGELKKEGYTIEKYSEGNFEGFKIIKKINNIDEVSTDKDVEFDLSGMMEENEDNKYMFKVVKNGDKNTYYAKFKFDSNDSGLKDEEDDDEYTNEGGQALPDEALDSQEEILDGTTGGAVVPSTDSEDKTDTSSLDDLDLSGMMSNLDLSFNVNLPSKAISSNATTKEDGDKKLSWKLNYSGAQTIEFAFEIDPNASNGNMLLYVGIGAGVLVLAGVAFALISASKKKNNLAAPVQEVKEETQE